MSSRKLRAQSCLCWKIGDRKHIHPQTDGCTHNTEELWTEAVSLRGNVESGAIAEEIRAKGVSRRERCWGGRGPRDAAVTDQSRRSLRQLVSAVWTRTLKHRWFCFTGCSCSWIFKKIFLSLTVASVNDLFVFLDFYFILSLGLYLLHFNILCPLLNVGAVFYIILLLILLQ